jgi:hypothetical protein
MMYLCQNLLLLLLLLGLSSPVTVNAKLKGRRSLPEVEERRTEELVERRPCVSFDLPWIQNAIVEGPSNPWRLHSSECDTNDCSDEVSWCCRAYTHALHCDTKNDFPYQPVRKKMIRNVFIIISRPCTLIFSGASLLHQCICNSNTATPAPTTVAPTPAPTPAPTKEDRGGGDPGGEIPLCNSDFGSPCTTSTDCCSERCFGNKCQKSAPTPTTSSKQSVSAIDRAGGRVRGGAAGLQKNGFTSPRPPIDFGGGGRVRGR